MHEFMRVDMNVEVSARFDMLEDALLNLPLTLVELDIETLELESIWRILLMSRCYVRCLCLTAFQMFGVMDVKTDGLVITP
eukprot:1043999-Amphidinium_carterae.1